jgi:hypothetical protein
MLADKRTILSSKAAVAPNALPRIERTKALETTRHLLLYLQAANEPEDSVALLGRIMPSFKEVLAGVQNPSTAPPERWTREEIETHTEQQKQRSEELQEERAEEEAERYFMGDLLRRLARMPKQPSPLLAEPFEIPPLLGWRLRIALDAQDRVHIEPVFPRLAELWGDFRSILDGLDAERLRECPKCKKLFWKKRVDQSGCGRVCDARIRQDRYYRKHPETVKNRVRLSRARRQKNLGSKSKIGRKSR